MGRSTHSLIINSANVNEEHIAEVRARMGELFQLKDEQLDKVFSGKPLRFIKNIDHDTAQRYCTAIDEIGMTCQIEDASDNGEASSFELEPLDSKNTMFETDKEKTYFCPMCKVQQASENECQHCYFNLDVYRNTMKENNFIEVPGRGYIAERRREHRRNSFTVRREVIRMGVSSDRRVMVDRRGVGAWSI